MSFIGSTPCAPLTELSDAPVIAFIMDIGLRMEAAQEAYTILRSFSQLSLCHTDCVDEHAPGQDRQAVCQMRLENHSNTCYMNAFLTAWMSYSWPLKHPALFMCRLARVCWLCLRPVAPSMSYESYVTRCGLKSLVTGRTLTHYMTLLSLPPSRHRSCPLTACACCGSLVLPPSRAMQSFWALTSPP